MVNSFDKEFVDLWIKNVIEPNRLEGTWDVDARFEEMARGGLAAEVIFPDFGIPFELYSKFVAALNNYRLTHEQRRGLVLRLQPVARRLLLRRTRALRRHGARRLRATSMPRWPRSAGPRRQGSRACCLPTFSAEFPVFHPEFEPIWSLLEELEMPVNSHTAISGTFEFGLLPTGIDELFPRCRPIPAPLGDGADHPEAVFYSVHQMLMHFIWGGVLENHPNLQLVLTETGSAWAAGAVRSMDYTWEGAFTPRVGEGFLKRAAVGVLPASVSPRVVGLLARRRWRTSTRSASSR